MRYSTNVSYYDLTSFSSNFLYIKFFSSTFKCKISSGNFLASTNNSFNGVDTASSSISKKFPLIKDYFMPSKICLVIAISCTRRSKSLGSSITSGSSTTLPSSSTSAGLNPFSNLLSCLLLSFSLARWFRRFFFNSKTGILY